MMEKNPPLYFLKVSPYSYIFTKASFLLEFLILRNQRAEHQAFKTWKEYVPISFPYDCYFNRHLPLLSLFLECSQISLLCCHHVVVLNRKIYVNHLACCQTHCNEVKLFGSYVYIYQHQFFFDDIDTDHCKNKRSKQKANHRNSVHDLVHHKYLCSILIQHL